jgi:nitroreductase
MTNTGGGADSAGSGRATIKETAMDVFEAVRTVLAVREYDDRPVPPEVIDRVAEAAHLTASSKNEQPWHFVFVEDRDTLRQLGELARSGPYTAQAAFAVVVGYQQDSVFGVSDTSRAIQSMVLTAWEDGVGSNFVGFHGLDAVKPVLGIPDDIEVLAIIPFGYPVRPGGKGKKRRKPIGEVVHRNRFDQPWA